MSKQTIYVVQDEDGDVLGATLTVDKIPDIINTHYAPFYFIKNERDIRDSEIFKTIIIEDKLDSSNKVEITIHYYDDDIT